MPPTWWTVSLILSWRRGLRLWPHLPGGVGLVGGQLENEIDCTVRVAVRHADELLHCRARRVQKPQAVVDWGQGPPDDRVGRGVAEDLLDRRVRQGLIVGAVLGVEQLLDVLVRSGPLRILRTARPGVHEGLAPATATNRRELALGAGGRTDAAGPRDADACQELGVKLPAGAVDAAGEPLAQVA